MRPDVAQADAADQIDGLAERSLIEAEVGVFLGEHPLRLGLSPAMASMASSMVADGGLFGVGLDLGPAGLLRHLGSV